MKWHLYLIMVLLLVSVVYGINECQGVMDKSDIPCSIISTWQFPNNCGTYTIKVFNSNGTLLSTTNMDNYSLTGRCNITFNYTSKDSYLLNWSTGDSSKILVESDEDMLLGMVIGIGIIAALFLFIAFKLEDEHLILKLLLIFTSITLITLIPAQLITEASESTFYKVMLGFFVVFWLYVGIYFVYWVLKRFGMIVSGGKDE